MRYNIFALLLIVALFAAVSGCTSQPPQDAMDAANVTADRILSSVNTGDYASYSTNFSEGMNAASTESNFNDVRNKILDQQGRYVSRSPAPQASVEQGYNVFVYDCQFEKGTYRLRLVMNTANTSMVEGIWFPDLK